MKPHSFVLLPTPGAETDRCPDHILEGTPGVHASTCPACDGAAFVEAVGSVWCTHHLGIIRPSLNRYLRACGRCRGRGLVLDYNDPADYQQAPLEAQEWKTAA